MATAPKVNLKKKDKQKGKKPKKGGIAPTPKGMAPEGAVSDVFYEVPSNETKGSVLPMADTFTKAQKKKAKGKKSLAKKLDSFAGNLSDLLGKYDNVKAALAGEAAPSPGGGGGGFVAPMEPAPAMPMNKTWLIVGGVALLAAFLFLKK